MLQKLFGSGKKANDGIVIASQFYRHGNLLDGTGDDQNALWVRSINSARRDRHAAYNLTTKFFSSNTPHCDL